MPLAPHYPQLPHPSVPHAVKSSGSVDIYPGDVTASLSVAMGTSAGSATVSTENTNVNFGASSAPSLLAVRTALSHVPVTGSFKVKFHGDASWLYNILLKLLQGTLRKAIAKAVNGALTKAINNECVTKHAVCAKRSLFASCLTILQRKQGVGAHSPRNARGRRRLRHQLHAGCG